MPGSVSDSLQMRRIAAGAAAVLAALLVAGCGAPTSAPAPTPPASSAASPADATADKPSAAPTSPGTAAPEAELITVSIANGKVSPPPGRIEVSEGSKVRIEVRSDVRDEAHLHGYDLTAKLGPGETGVLEFTADQSGLFELETHDSGTVLTQLVIR